MPAPSYTKSEVAVHELGHCLFALAVELDWEHVRVFQKNGQWVGQCRLAAPRTEIPLATLCAFQMGGPIVQIQLIPESLGQHITNFKPSLFARASQPPDALTDMLNAVLWASDLAGEAAPMMQMAPNGLRPDWMKLHFGDFLWLPQLEGICHELAAAAGAGAFIDELHPKLVSQGQLSVNTCIEAFDRTVGSNTCNKLRDFITRY